MSCIRARLERSARVCAANDGCGTGSPTRAVFVFARGWGAGSRAERPSGRVNSYEHQSPSALPKAGAQLPVLERSALNKERGVFMRWLVRNFRFWISDLVFALPIAVGSVSIKRSLKLWRLGLAQLSIAGIHPGACPHRSLRSVHRSGRRPGTGPHWR